MRADEGISAYGPPGRKGPSIEDLRLGFNILGSYGGDPETLFFQGTPVKTENDRPIRRALAGIIADEGAAGGTTVDTLFLHKFDLFIEAFRKGLGFEDAKSYVLTAVGRMGVPAAAATADLERFQDYWRGAP